MKGIADLCWSHAFPRRFCKCCRASNF